MPSSNRRIHRTQNGHPQRLLIIATSWSERAALSEAMKKSNLKDEHLEGKPDEE